MGFDFLALEHSKIWSEMGLLTNEVVRVISFFCMREREREREEEQGLQLN